MGMPLWLSDRFHHWHLIPLLKSVLKSGTVFSCAQTVSSRLEIPTDGTERGKKALRVFG
jgi:hypothetical protein